MMSQLCYGYGFVMQAITFVFAFKYVNSGFCAIYSIKS